MRRSRRNGGVKAAEEPAPAPGNPGARRQSVLQMQELQDILDDQSHKLMLAKTCYVQQNTAIAKENSQLKVKLSEMESKVSELIQENMSIRSTLTVQQVNYKKQLSTHIKDIECSLVTRFQGILDMLQSFQREQQLPPSGPPATLNIPTSDLPDPIKRIDLLSSSMPTSKDAPLHPDTSASVSPSITSTSSRKRRKSSRRQSMFVPSDFEFPLGNLDNDEQEASPTADVGSPNISPAVPQVTDVAINDDDFTNSIIDYSIPEEKDDKIEKKKHLFITSSDSSSLLPITNSSSLRGLSGTSASAAKYTQPPLSKSSSKLSIYKDDPLEESLSPAKDKPSPHHTSAKHPVNPPRIKSKKRKIVDEIMPTSTYPELNQPRRRTRGKSINYALPSLRAKMRRPSEKLVDATTITDINDLQVNKIKTTHDNSKSASPEPTNIPAKVVSQPISIVAHPIESVKKDIQNKSSSPLTDKDVNKRRPNSQKKKRLFKPAIVNDLNDETTMENNKTSSRPSSQDGRSVSFRLQDDDLSVFDLIPKKPATPRTYKNSHGSSTKASNFGKTFRL